MNAKPTLQEQIAKMSPDGQAAVKEIAEAINADPSMKLAREVFTARTSKLKLWESAAIKDFAFRLAKDTAQ